MEKNNIANGKETVNPFHKRTLFVRFPRPVKDKNKIKDLHPGIEAVHFKRRIKKWCHIRFENEEIAKLALKKLHKKKLEHGELTVLKTKVSTIKTPLARNEKVDPHVHKEAVVSSHTQNKPENIMKSSKHYKVSGIDVPVPYTKSCVSKRKNIVQKKQKQDVKSNKKRKHSSDKRDELTVASESESDCEGRNNEETTDEMDTKEVSDDEENIIEKNDDDDEDEQDVKGEENESDGFESEISNTSGSGNVSIGEGEDGNSTD